MRHIAHVDGVMLGRAAYHDPYVLARVEHALFGTPLPERDEILHRLEPYIAEQIRRGNALHHIGRHVLGLYLGEPGARSFRRYLSENMRDPRASAQVSARCARIDASARAGGVMIVFSAREFLDAYSPDRFPATHAATARVAFLVSPTGFSLAAESATDNRYMAMQERASAGAALLEHAGLAAALRTCLPTIVFPGDATTPDAVFPNNVFATVPGKLIVGAMRHAVRRREAERADIRAFFTDLLGYDSRRSVVARILRRTDRLARHRPRAPHRFLRIVRTLRSRRRARHARGVRSRAHLLLRSGARRIPHQCRAGGAGIAWRPHRAGRIRGAASVEAIAQVYGERVLRIDPLQKAAFAANAITLSSDAVWMSERAADSLSAAQRDALSGWGFSIRSVPLAEIEKAGGSLRCCVGEIF